MQKIWNAPKGYPITCTMIDRRIETSASTLPRRVLLGMVVLLATASLLACETARATPGDSPAQNIQAAPGVIFSDSMVAAVQANHAARHPTAADKNYEIYFHGVQSLHRGHADQAERDAEKAIAADAKFSDAYALAATAQLSQRKFEQALNSAQMALTTDPSNEKAYVILATADNYLGQYEDAAAALGHVKQDSATWWQISYQLARADAGLNDVQGALNWSNRAALQAPQDFAPLHLLHASALLAIAQYKQAADELEVYLKLEGKQAPQRDELRRELQRLRQQAHSPVSNS